MLKHSKRLTEFARANRKNPTLAETLLWEELRGPRFDGLRFRRQHQIDTYIVDFVCLRARVIVELDGDSHIDVGVADLARQTALEAAGFVFMRFNNSDVLEGSSEVGESVSVFCVERAKTLFGDEYCRRRARSSSS